MISSQFSDDTNRSADRMGRRTGRTAIDSFAAACLVGMGLLSFWSVSRPQPVTPAVQRHLSDVQVQFRCPDGHEFTRSGRINRPKCPECERESDTAVTYYCPEHGELRALIRFVRIATEPERVSAVSFRFRIWTPVTGQIRCPDCGLSLRAKKVNPFAHQLE